jgi:ribonuclease R
MGPESSPVDTETLGDIAAHLTATERRAMAAERQAGERYVAAFMSDRQGERFAGRIAGVSRSGLFIRLDETGADGFVPVSTLEGDFWVHDEEQASLVGRRRMQRYDMGMQVEVTLIEAAPLTGGLLLRMATPPRRPRNGRTAEPVPAATRGGPKRPSGGRNPERGEAQEHGKHGVRRHTGGRKKSR